MGFSFIAVGIAALIARAIAGRRRGRLARDDGHRRARGERRAWSIGTSVLAEIAGAMIVYGVFIVIAAWLAGNDQAGGRGAPRDRPVLPRAADRLRLARRSSSRCCCGGLRPRVSAARSPRWS